MSTSNFFLSASDLVHLNLRKIRNFMFTSPEAMVTCLGVLPNLRELFIKTKPASAFPGPTSYVSSSCTVLPLLTLFDFRGGRKYLDDVVARIDTPLLDTLHIRFLSSTDLNIDLSRLNRFIVHAEGLWPLHQARLESELLSARITLGSRTVLLLRRDPHQRLSSTGQLCNQLSSLLSHVEQLIICFANLAQLWWRDIKLALRVFNLDFSARLSPCRDCMYARNW